MINKYNNTKFDLTKTLIPEAHILIQKIFFTLGYRWSYDTQDIREFPFKYIFIYAHDAIMTIGDNESIFFSDSKKELNLDDFIAEQQLDNVKKIISDHFAIYKVFSLPNRWFIRVTKENRSILEKWKGSKLVTLRSDSILLSNENWSAVSETVLSKHVEITLDQFKEHVLKESSEKTFELPFEWCVEVTEASREILSIFRTHVSKNKYKIASVGGFIAKTGCHYLNRPLYMTEITFEQFKKHVLKEGSEIMKGDVVVALTTMSDPIYATHKITKGMQYRVKDIQGSKQLVEVYGVNAYWPIESFQLFSEIEKEKKSFILPSKWCIVQYHEVAMYMNKLEGWSGWSEDLELFSHFPKSNKSGSTVDDGHNKYCHREIQPGYTQITLQQFKEHVLMQPLEQIKPAREWEIGDVVCRIRTPYEDTLIGGHAYSISSMIISPKSVEIQIEGSDLLWDAKFFTFSHRPEKKQLIPVSEWKSGDVIIRKLVPDDLLKSGQEYTIDQVTHQKLDGRTMVTLIGKGFKWNAETFEFGHRPEKNPKETAKPFHEWEVGDIIQVTSMNQRDAMRGLVPLKGSLHVIEVISHRFQTVKIDNFEGAWSENNFTFVKRPKKLLHLATSKNNSEKSAKSERENEILFHPNNDFDTICSATTTTGKKIETDRQYQSIVKK